MDKKNLLLCLLVFFSSVVRTADGSSSATVAAAAPKSSLLLPTDVSFNETTVAALSALRNAKAALDELASSGNEDRLTLTMCGYKGEGEQKDQVNQDRAFVIDPYLNNNGMLLGVMDGHGPLGHSVAEFCRQGIPLMMQGPLERVDHTNSTAVSQVLIQTLEMVDKAIPKDIAFEGGATVSMVLQYHNKLYFANAGDSQSMLAAYVNGQLLILHKTRLDKPDHPEERQRILKAGGSVTDAGDYDDARVQYYIDGHEWGLAMSRSLGDRSATGVIATPLVNVFDLDELANSIIQDWNQTCEAEVNADGTQQTCKSQPQISPEDVQFLVVSATDGLIDYLNPNEILYELSHAFFEGEEHPLTAADVLIQESAKRWHKDFHGHYRDDMAIAAARITKR